MHALPKIGRGFRVSDFFRICRLVVRFPIPSCLPIWISNAVYNLQQPQRPIALISRLCGVGGLKIPWVSKSVGSGFLLTNCQLMVKIRLFRLFHDRQYKKEKMYKKQIIMNPDLFLVVYSCTRPEVIREVISEYI